jgi:hydrogenase maturation protease
MNEWEWQLLEDKNLVDHVDIDGAEVRVGDRVRLRPRDGGDIMDLALAGQVALVESIEQDYESKIHVCLVLDNDPGRDLGLLRQPGHRFFFEASEIEALPPGQARPEGTTQPASVLVAGIGNIFLGDDGFGVEVVKRLAARKIADGVRIADFGIRSLDLAYALQDGYETTILVDAYAHGQPPGTVSLIEPDLDNLGEPDAAMVEAHSMNPLSVLRMVMAMSAVPKNVLLVGCEPLTFGGEEGYMGLSAPVEAAVDEAAKMVNAVVERVLQADQKPQGSTTARPGAPDTPK